MAPGKKNDPPIRFRGGGLDGHRCPANLIDVSLPYHAYRNHRVRRDDEPKLDCYLWEPGSGAMVYVGTVFGYDGPQTRRKVKLEPIKPPTKWFWKR